MMDAGSPITLKEVQLRLGVPQHVLIHLCEKGVIDPDFADTSGRGKRREFSERNVFEFGVALALRRLDLPVAAAALLIRILRSFARATAKALPGFELPGALLAGKMQLHVLLHDDGRLVLAAEGGSLRKPLVLSARVPEDWTGSGPSVRLQKLPSVPASYEARLDLDLGEIARRIRK
jgi:hypothetical protein